MRTRPRTGGARRTGGLHTTLLRLSQAVMLAAAAAALIRLGYLSIPHLPGETNKLNDAQ